MTLPQADKRVAGRYLPLISDEATAGLAQIEYHQCAMDAWPLDAQVAIARMERVLARTESTLERIVRLATQARAGFPPAERERGT